MSRTDLLLQLVRAGASNDHAMLERTVAALVAEARAKQHHTLADRLTKVLGDSIDLRAPRSVGGSSLPDKIRELLVERPARRSLDDLVLPDAVQTETCEFVEEQRGADLLRSYSLEPRHKVMLVGPPGNGKTTLAEAIAFELSVPLYVVRYEAIIGSYLGETASRLKRVFDFARTTPCVLFLDEFDAIGKERGDVHETGEIKRVVSSLLMQIDELPSYTIVICATNHPELLDRAVWRRFQMRLELPPPTPAQLARLVADAERTLGKRLGVAPQSVARALKGASFAEAEEFILDLRRRMVLSGTGEPTVQIVKRRLKFWRERFARALGEDTNYDGPEPDHPPRTDRDGETTDEEA